MKKIKNLWMVMLVLALAFGMVACTEPDPFDPEVVETYFGKYTTTYTSGTGADAKTVVETVDFSKTAFKITDSIATITFTIDADGWDTTTVTPSDYIAEYPYAFKFTGKITSAVPTKAAEAVAGDSYIGSQRTGPDLVDADINTTVCWMYLYFNGKEDNFTFVRSPFSKTGGTDRTTVVTGTDGKARKYDKAE